MFRPCLAPDVPRTHIGPVHPDPQSRSSAEYGRVPASTFASIVAIAADGIITIDAEQQIIFFNEGAERIFGWSAGEILGQPLQVLIPERFRGVHEGHVRGFGHGRDSARKMDRRSEIAGLRRNGEEFPAEASISRVTNEGETVYTVVIRDITDRKRIADRLRFLAEAGESLAGQQDIGELLATVARLPVGMLGEACVADVLLDGGPAVQASHAEEGVRQALAEARLAALRAHERSQLPQDVVRQDGQVVSQAIDPAHPPAWLPIQVARQLGPVRALTVPLRARGSTIGSLLLLRSRPWDEADHVLAEDYARRAALAIDGARLLEQVRRALRVRDDVTGIVSHDLRNPVQAIKMLAGAIAAAGARVPEHVLDHAGVIRQAAEQMDRLIQDLLDATRLEAGRLTVTPRPERAAALLTIAIEPLLPLARARGQALSCELADPLPDVNADAGRIAQVLSNLVGNAIKFTPEGGRIGVRADDVDGDLLVRVTDSGPGIPEELRERVFDRWVQIRGGTSSGAGLGLPIAKGIVEAHGGRIWHEPAVGGGSVFAFTLPGA